MGQIDSEADEVIATCPVSRRREPVAANVVWEVPKRVRAALADYRAAQTELSPVDDDEATGVPPLRR